MKQIHWSVDFDVYCTHKNIFIEASRWCWVNHKVCWPSRVDMILTSIALSLGLCGHQELTSDLWHVCLFSSYAFLPPLPPLSSCLQHPLSYSSTPDVEYKVEQGHGWLNMLDRNRSWSWSYWTAWRAVILGSGPAFLGSGHSPLK